MAGARGVGINVDASIGGINVTVGGAGGGGGGGIAAGAVSTPRARGGGGMMMGGAAGTVMSTSFTRGVGGVRSALAGLRGNFLGVFFAGLFYQMSLQRVSDAQERLNQVTEEFGPGSEEAVQAQKDLAGANSLLRIQMIQMNVQMLFIIADMLTYTASAIAAARATRGLTASMALLRFAGPIALAVGGGAALFFLLQALRKPASDNFLPNVKLPDTSTQFAPVQRQGGSIQPLAPASRAIGLGVGVSNPEQPQMLRLARRVNDSGLATRVDDIELASLNSARLLSSREGIEADKRIKERGMNIESVVVNVRSRQEGSTATR